MTISTDLFLSPFLTFILIFLAFSRPCRYLGALPNAQIPFLCFSTFTCFCTHIHLHMFSFFTAFTSFAYSHIVCIDIDDASGTTRCDMTLSIVSGACSYSLIRTSAN